MKTSINNIAITLMPVFDTGNSYPHMWHFFSLASTSMAQAGHSLVVITKYCRLNIRNRDDTP